MAIYSKWVQVTWDLSGVAVTELGIAQPQVNTSAVFTLTPYAEYTMAHWNGRAQRVSGGVGDAVTKAQFLKKFNAIQAGLKKNRDDLRDLMDEAEGIMESADEALVSIEEAADALSKYL